MAPLFRIEPEGLVGSVDVDSRTRQAFRVHQGRLTVTTTWRTRSDRRPVNTAEPERIQVHLGNATIRVYDDGLLIRPAWGGPLTRLQGRAAKGEWEELAERLREEGTRALSRGSAADVPVALTGIARPSEDPWWEGLLRILWSWWPWSR